MMSGIIEPVRREFGVNLTGGRVNAIEMSQKVLGVPTMDTLLNKYLEQKAKKQPASQPNQQPQAAQFAGEDLAA